MRYTPIIPQRLNPITELNKVLSVGEYFPPSNLPPARDSAQNLLRYLADNVLEVDKWGDTNLSGMPRLYRSVMVEKWTQYDTKSIGGIEQEYTGTVDPYGMNLNSLWKYVFKNEDRDDLKKQEGWYWFNMLRVIDSKETTALKNLKDQNQALTSQQAMESPNLKTLILNLYDKDNMRWYDVEYVDFKRDFYRTIDIMPNPRAYAKMVNDSPLKPMFEWLAKNHGGSWPRKVIEMVKEMRDIKKIKNLDTWKTQVQKWGLKSSYTRLFDVQQQRTLAPEEASLARKGYIALARKQQRQEPIQEEVARTLDRPLTEAEREKINYLIGYNYGLEAICAIIQNKEVQKKILGFCSD